MSGTLANRLLGGVLVVLLVSLGMAVGPAPARAAGASGAVVSPGVDCTKGTTITNGTVLLGVNCLGDLGTNTMADGYPVDSTSRGLYYVPTKSDAVSVNCTCEGWGVADGLPGGVTGYANQTGLTDEDGNVIAPGTSSNLTLESFTRSDDGKTATSVVDVAGTFQVTQTYAPNATTADLYDVTVQVTNTSTSSVDLRYRRVMDWDIQPTPFKEFVTLQQGTSPRIKFTSDDGFASSDPLSGPSQIKTNGSFVDSGPADLGALFDFDFGSLSPNASRTFKIFYGAAPTEAMALKDLNDVAAEAYSLGQPDGGRTSGKPNTFIFAFKDIEGSGTAASAPYAVADDVRALPATATPIDVLANDSDPADDPLTITSATAPAHGSVDCTLNSSTSCSYKSAVGFEGDDSFTYTIYDGNGGYAHALVTVHVAPNRPPTTTLYAESVDEDSGVGLDLTAHATDADSDPLTFVVPTTTAHGALTCDGPSCNYVPAPDFNGTDTFTYTVTDGRSQPVTGTVKMTVAPVNDAPVAVADPTLQATEDTDLVLTVTGNDTDVDGDALTPVIVTQPRHGAISCVSGTCTYTPDANYFGPDSFSYQASDGSLTSAVMAVSVNVAAVNDPPVGQAKSLTTAEDTSGTVNVVTGATDVEGDAVSYDHVGSPAHGTVTCTSLGVCTYTPTANYHGPDSFLYYLTDGAAVSSATVTVSVSSVNDAPVPAAKTLSLAEDATGSVNVLAGATDADQDTITFDHVGAATHGTVACSAGVCTYTPVKDYFGPDAFTYWVSDGTTTASATVSVTVTPVNDAPVATSATVTTPEDVSTTITLAGTDVDGDALTYSVTQGTHHGTLTRTANGVYTYAPDPNWNGTETVTFTASDGTLLSTGTVTIVVTAVNDKPVAQAISATTAEDTAQTITLSATDVDGDTLTYTAGAAGHGTVSCTVTACTYTPAPNYNGPDSFTYTVTDGHGGSDTKTVSITVTPVNDAPVAGADKAHANPATAFTFPVTANDTDVDGDALVVTSVTQPTHGSVTCGSSACTYTPTAGWTGDDTFTYVVSDGHGGTATGTVTVTTAENLLPVLGAPTLKTPVGVVGTVQLLDGASDPNGDALTIPAFTQPLHGSVVCLGSLCSYTPEPGYHGKDSFTYDVSDGHGGLVTGTVKVTVTQSLTVPDAPRLAKTQLGTAAVLKALTKTLTKDYAKKPGTKAAKAKALAKAKKALAAKKFNLLAGWVEPANNGGSKITGYKVVVLSYAAPKTKAKSPKAKAGATLKLVSKKTISSQGQDLTLALKLKPGTYKIQVMAVNAQGSSELSGMSRTLVVKKK